MLKCEITTSKINLVIKKKKIPHLEKHACQKHASQNMEQVRFPEKKNKCPTKLFPDKFQINSQSLAALI